MRAESQVRGMFLLTSGMNATLNRHRFRAMGTDVELLVESGEAGDALATAEEEFHRLEALLTRFRPESELSRLNADGKPCCRA